MTTLESDKVQKALAGKMRGERKDTGDWYYIIRNDQGITVATTSISKGAKHTLGAYRVSDIAKQLHLNRVQLLVDLVSCRLDRAGALAIIEANCPPHTPWRHG